MLLLCTHEHTGWLHTATYYCTVPLLLVVMHIGMAGIKTNLLTYGSDQLQDCPTDEVKAFVSWYVWTEGFGLGIVTYFCGWSENVSVGLLVVVQAGLASAVICLDITFHRWLITDPVTPNPLRTVAGVIKYAVQNKAPRNRSAFTYCEREIPSRLDFAKMDYGGPFSAGQVEDVKTFFRILCVLVTFFGYYIGGENVFNFASHLNGGGNAHDYCVWKLINLSGSNLFVPTILILVPLYELVAYPLFHRCNPGMLKCVGCGMLLILCCILSQFILDATWQVTSTTPLPCPFVPDTNGTGITSNIEHTWFGIPSVLSGSALVVFYTSTYQFILAQTPNSMKGLMLGLLYMLRGFFSILSIATTLSFRLGYTQHPSTTPLCGLWFYLLSSVMIVAGFAAFCVVAQRYKRRVRGERVYDRIYVEKYFEYPPN